MLLYLTFIIVSSFLLNFITDITKLAKLCEFVTLEDEMIRDRIVVGIFKQTVKERLLREANLTLQMALSICRADEESSKGLTIMTKTEEIEEICAIKKGLKKM